MELCYINLNVIIKVHLRLCEHIKVFNYKEIGVIKRSARITILFIRHGRVIISLTLKFLIRDALAISTDCFMLMLKNIAHFILKSKWKNVYIRNCANIISQRN